jgi:hypothetical protein
MSVEQFFGRGRGSACVVIDKGDDAAKWYVRLDKPE